MPGKTTIVTTAPGGGDARLLEDAGLVHGLVYSSAMPGGYDQLTAILTQQAHGRTTAVDSGRKVTAWRGLSRVWRGILDEPQPAESGWTITAHGDGTWGGDYRMYYANPAEFSDHYPIISHAQEKGLDWRLAADDMPTGYIVEPPPDNASESVADWLNTLVSSPPQVWLIDRHGFLHLGPIPSAPTRLITAVTPPSRTITAGVNAVWVRYISADNGKGDTSYGTTYAVNQPAADRHGTIQDEMDVTSAGVLTEAQARAYGMDALARYQAAPFSSPLTVSFGQLTNLGGVPCDLGCERAGEVYRVLLADSPYGGEVTPGPVQFAGGRVEYDNDSGLLTVTPYMSYLTDFQSVIAQVLTRRAR